MDKQSSQRVLLHIAPITILLATICSGCACNEDFRIVNHISEKIEVQLLLPLPVPYFETAGFNACMYSIQLAPSESWSSSHARLADRSKLPLKFYPGIGLMRVKQAGLLIREWKAIDLGRPSKLIIEITKGADDALRIWLQEPGKSRRQGKSPEGDYFRS